MKIWDNGYWRDSIAEAQRIDLHANVLKHTVYYHPEHTGAIYYDRDCDIDQGIGPIIPMEIKGRKYDTHALRDEENKIYHATAASPDAVIIVSEHPYLRTTDDRCLEHAIPHPRTRARLIAGIYDENRGGCGAIIWLAIGMETVLWQCCPEDNWPHGATIAPWIEMMRYHAKAKENVANRPHHSPNQLPLFDTELVREVTLETRREQQTDDSTA